MPQVQTRQKDPRDSLLIDFPFQVVIQHPALSVPKMIMVSKDLDFHEVRQPDPKLEKLRNDLVVDVLFVKETQTRIEVKPRQPMSYDAIAQELETILKHFSTAFKGTVKVVEIDWLVDRKGLASDQRSTQRRVV